ncbi:NAD(P)H-dependent oxidoreductase [[Pseudopropionibacterium] massiliense]|uniref:NAD(P)H-dependent oxidoreductase n=1 Tax=[Pseudopropionibacterium] massiliense TaxID=2220000 RepID=UPI00103023BD|nr:NAD(P)H-dependent oxidoreductase [[Pseudopropionibacterium] massiliense]
MHTTVLLFHPNLAASRVNARLAQAARGAGSGDNPVEVRDMYALYPDFHVDVAAEQAACEATDRIVLQFPMYWYSSPALLKQWQDDVLTYGWAYGSTGKALHGKEIALAVSPGAPASSYDHSGDAHYELHELLRPFQAMSNMVGTRFVTPFITAGTLTLSDEDLEKQAESYTAWLTSEQPALDLFG